jgi:hypothetical protein
VDDSQARRAGGALAAFVLAGLASVTALDAAQAQAPRTPAAVTTGSAGRRDVRVPDSVPNISGTWLSRSSNRSALPVDGGPTPFLPWAQGYFDERAAAEKTGMPLFDTNASCLPSGVPRVLPVPYPLDIVQTPEFTIISIEVMHSFRIIHTDNKDPPPDYKPSYLGYSRGYWDGDTLVVTTTGMNGFTQVDEEGRPKSSGIKVTEHIRKVAPDILENTYTIDDPNTYAHPWSSRARFQWSEDARLNEYICEENNRNKPDASGKLRHGDGRRFIDRNQSKK